MAKFANAFNLLGETEDNDVKELISAVDERAESSYLAAQKKKAAAEARKKAIEQARIAKPNAPVKLNSLAEFPALSSK